MALSRTAAAARLKAVLEQLRKSRPQLGMKLKNNVYWIRCIYHGGGKERTPSLVINADPRDKRFFRAHCFACGKNATWPQLAAKLRCDPIDEGRGDNKASFYDDQAIELFTASDAKRLIGEESASTHIPTGFTWPERTPWRTIDGVVVHAAGGLLYIDRFYDKERDEHVQEERLFLPLVEYGELQGGVRANIKPKKGGNYFNSTGLASSKFFLFTDLAESMLSGVAQGRRVLAVSEGPRDALNVAQLGYPSICNLGALNSWSQDKINHILRLSPDVVILMMDGDEPGRSCAIQMIEDLRGLVNTHDVIFPTKKLNGKIKKLFDASDLNEKQVDRIVAEACAAYGLKAPDPYDWSVDDTSEWWM
jgi:5S rRNA maturation endonuclease (ribonuclease M5)